MFQVNNNSVLLTEHSLLCTLKDNRYQTNVQSATGMMYEEKNYKRKAKTIIRFSHPVTF